jgi:hypothetical protein
MNCVYNSDEEIRYAQETVIVNFPENCRLEDREACKVDISTGWVKVD